MAEAKISNNLSINIHGTVRMSARFEYGRGSAWVEQSLQDDVGNIAKMTIFFRDAEAAQKYAAEVNGILPAVEGDPDAE